MTDKLNDELSDRMTLPFDGPLMAPVMSISESWYLARLEELKELEAESRKHELESNRLYGVGQEIEGLRKRLENGLEEIRHWSQTTALRAKHSEILLVVERMCDNALATEEE